MSPAIPPRAEVFRDADASLQPLVEAVNAKLKEKPLDLAAVKSALVALLEFLDSPVGRTNANCRAVDGFFFHDDTWVNAELPDAYHDVLAHMDALHDTFGAAHIAQNFDSTPEQLLARARNL
jgi:hypothetical protein